MNGCGSVTSSPATLIVNSSPSITDHPMSQSLCEGGAVTFTVSANGTPPLSYQWRRGGTPLSGATGAMLTISNAQMADVAAYDVEIMNTCGTVISNPATLSLGTTPTILSQPATQTACTGDAVTLTVAANGSAPLSYQWRKGGANISGATTASYTLPASQASDAGAYDVLVTNACGSITSSPATLTLRTAPVIIAQPQGRSVCAGTLTTFSVRGNGTPPLGYRWRKGGIDIPGATSPTLTIGAVQATDAGAYDVVVTNSCGSITSSAATLTTRALRRWYRDIDGDGFGNLSVTRMDCDQPVGYVSVAGDCDDTRGVIHPGSPEICGNGLDDDCDGQMDGADSDCVSSTPNDPVPPPPVPMPTMGGGICGVGSAASGMMCLLFLCGARLNGHSRRRRK
ncbi:MAG: immunoglobulin domain-containing protein [Phycisphaerae bacterium]